jgi:hypothetical protein
VHVRQDVPLFSLGYALLQQRQVDLFFLPQVNFEDCLQLPGQTCQVRTRLSAFGPVSASRACCHALEAEEANERLGIALRSASGVLSRLLSQRSVMVPKRITYLGHCSSPFLFAAPRHGASTFVRPPRAGPVSRQPSHGRVIVVAINAVSPPSGRAIVAGHGDRDVHSPDEPIHVLNETTIPCVFQRIEVIPAHASIHRIDAMVDEQLAGALAARHRLLDGRPGMITIMMASSLHRFIMLDPARPIAFPTGLLPLHTG